ncbi:MAG: branched-chain amino acid aminotransferase [Paracoccaceae bacterium]
MSGQSLAWMDGKIIPLEDAKIGVTDLGLTHSDITYDVVQVWDGAFFRLQDHLDRFLQSMKIMHLAVPQSRADMQGILQSLAGASGFRDAYCAFVTSRGPQLVPGSRDPRTCVNHFYAWIVPYVHVVSQDVVARGTRMKIADGIARISPESIDPTAKNYHWGDLTNGLFQALEEGFDTVVLADDNGNVCEGPGFNVFSVKDGVVLTARTGVLEGITRKSVLEICEQLKIPLEVRDVPVAEFLASDEVFITSSGGGPMPVTHVNDRIYSNGVEGPITLRIRELYLNWRANGPLRTAIKYG